MGFITLARLLGLAIRLFSQFLGRQRYQKFIYSFYLRIPPQMASFLAFSSWFDRKP